MGGIPPRRGNSSQQPDDAEQHHGEDRAEDDVTTRLLGARAECQAVGRFIAEGSFIVAGLPIAARVFQQLDPESRFEPEEGLDATTPEGAWSRRGAVSPYATVASFETGLADGDWSGAAWIRRQATGNDASDDWTLARKVVGVGASPVVRARAYKQGFKRSIPAQEIFEVGQ